MKYLIHTVSKYKSKRLEHAQTYQNKNPLIRFYFYDRLKKALELSEPSKRKTVIDIGCGEGYFLPTLSLNFKNVIGLDIKEPLKAQKEFFSQNENLNITIIDKAKNLLKAEDFYNRNIKLVTGNAHKLCFKNNSFDVVFMLDSLEHLLYPEIGIKEAERVLKKDGIFVVSLPNLNKINIKIRRFINIFTRTYREQKTKKEAFSYKKDYESKGSLQFHGHDFDWKGDGISIIKKYFKIEQIKWSPFNMFSNLNLTVLIKARKKNNVD